MYSASSGDRVLPRHLAAGGIFPKYLMRGMMPIGREVASPEPDDGGASGEAGIASGGKFEPVKEPTPKPKPKDAAKEGLIAKAKKALKSKASKKNKKA